MKEIVKSADDLVVEAKDLIREVAEKGQTVLVTQDGEAKLVLLNVETYYCWKESMLSHMGAVLPSAAFRGDRNVAQKKAFLLAEEAARRAAGIK